MASTLVGEMRKGSGGVKKGKGFQLSFTMTYHFLVVTDSDDTSREEVLLETEGLPIVGLLYGPLNLICTSKTAERRESHVRYWDVTCEFETGTEEQQQNPDNVSPDPTTWFPVFNISFETKERVITKDKSATPKDIVNSAGQPFETPLVEKRTICSVPFVQFEDAATTLATIMDRNETINNAEFEGCAEKTLLCQITGAERGYFGGFPAWRVSYVLKYDPDTWIIKMIDAGSSWKDGSDIKPYLDDTNTFRIYGMLDGYGGKASSSTEISFQPNEAINFDSFIRRPA